MSEDPRRTTITITVDHELCAGHARCNALAPEVYDLDDDGYCSITETTVDGALLDAARRGAAVCPEDAIRVVGPDRSDEVPRG